MSNVKQFYNKYTYPFSEIKNDNSINGDGLFLFLDYEANLNGFEGMSFLDAGCGTGQRVIDIAKSYEKANFIGIDFAESSIKLANEQLLHDKINNIKFECGDICEYTTQKRFDIVTSYGVLHHMDNPKKAVRNLTTLLKEDGLFVAWLYHSFGEFDRMLQRDMLRTLLGDKKDDYQLAVNLMNEMQYDLSQNRYGNVYGSKLNKQDKICKNADAYIHPLVSPYTFKEAIELFKNCGMDWCAIDQINCEEKGYFICLDQDESIEWVLDVGKHFNNPNAYKYYLELDKMDKLHIIELLTKPTGFTIFAGKDSSINKISERTKKNIIFLKDIK